MPPRVPKTPPAWLKDFVKHCETQDKKFMANVGDKIVKAFDRYWESFYYNASKQQEQQAKAKGGKGKKAGGSAKKTGGKGSSGAAAAAAPAHEESVVQQRQDPLAALENAVKKINEHTVMEGDAEELQRIQDGLAAAMQGLVPSLQEAIIPPKSASAVAATHSSEDNDIITDPATVDVKSENPNEDPETSSAILRQQNMDRDALMHEATSIYTHATAEIDIHVPPEAASVVKQDVDRLYSVTLRAIDV